MEKIAGPLGFKIPLQTLAASKEVKMTPSGVIMWRNSLPMADLGVTAKKIYNAINDCNQVSLSVKERFQILEIFQPTVQFVCQSLRKHYMNQNAPLTERQQVIATLAQTLQLEMADGYKIIIEQLSGDEFTMTKKQILTQSLERVIHYYSHVLIRSYHLYSTSPTNVWLELHLIYKYAEQHNFLKENNIENEYKRLLLLAGTYPYQWRYNEQEIIYRATETWTPLAILRNDLPSVSDPGFLVVDFSDDRPPMSLTRGLVQLNSSSKILDVNHLLNHIKTLLSSMEDNELKVRIAHQNEAEYTVPISVLVGLIREWGTPATRFQERTAISDPIELCVGLKSTHYYLNGEKPFVSLKLPEEKKVEIFDRSPTQEVTLKELSLENDAPIEKEDAVTIDFATFKSIHPKANEDSASYPIYPGTVINETPDGGYGLLWGGEAYPPIQAGEVIGLGKKQKAGRVFEIGRIRWLQHQSGQLRLGVERLSKTAKAGSAQLIKEGKPVGYNFRCLLLDSSILLPNLPFQSKGSVLVKIEGEETRNLELTKIIEATGSYSRFEFSASADNDIINTSDSKDIFSDKSDDDRFENIWSDL